MLAAQRWHCKIPPVHARPRRTQVDLQYPASRDKAAKAAEEARQLGISRLPGAALPAVGV